MKTKVLFKGEEQQISIALPFHYLLLELNTPAFELTEGEKLVLLWIVQAELTKAGLKKGQQMKYFGIVPIIEPRTAVGFSPPYSIFQLAVNWLATYDDLDNPNEYKDILTEIKELYEDVPELKGSIYTAIFHQPIRGVRGYCAHITDEDIIILFWGFDDLIEEDIEQDFSE